jgi:hypothetical protein
MILRFTCPDMQDYLTLLWYFRLGKAQIGKLGQTGRSRKGSEVRATRANEGIGAAARACCPDLPLRVYELQRG